MPFDTLRSIIGSKYSQKAFSAALVVSLAQNEIGDVAKVISFKNGVLRLNVKSSVAAAKVKAQEEFYIEKVNQALKTKLVQKLSFKVGE